MNYLLTGATGFLGKHFVDVLQSELLITVGRQTKNTICADLAKEVPVISQKIDVVVHNAGKAHIVPKTDEEKKAFFDVNLEGTKNLCQAFENTKNYPNTFVFISTVAVYGKETGTKINENSSLLGNTPYAESKIQAEQFLKNWSKKNHVNLVILRLPLVAGKEPLGNLGAMIKAIKKGYYFGIGDSSAKKSVVLATDIAELIPSLYSKNGIYNLTDTYHPSFKELEEVIAKQLSKKTPKALSLFFVKLLAKIGDVWSKFPINSDKVMKITADLTFDDLLAQKELNWKPKQVIKNFQIK